MNLRVAYLGPDWTYSHLAAIEFQPESDLRVACDTIDDVFAAILSGKSECGLVPLYNSASGLVSDTADSILRRLLGFDTWADQAWWKRPLGISGNLFVQVQHCLVGKGRLDQIRKVVSKQQALDQCSDWLAHRLPNAEQVACDSSAAALPLTTDASIAAIASQQAAESAQIPVIVSDIQDQSNNVTEFVVVLRDDQQGYQPIVAGESQRFEYWIEQLAMDSPEFGADLDSAVRSTDFDKPQWFSDHKFAGQRYRCFKCAAESTFQPGQSVTLEVVPAFSTNNKNTDNKKWRLGVS